MLDSVLPGRIHSESEIDATQQKVARTVRSRPSPGILPALPGARARPGLSQDESKAVIGGLLFRLLGCPLLPKEKRLRQFRLTGSLGRGWLVVLFTAPCSAVGGQAMCKSSSVARLTQEGGLTWQG